jgi:phage-related minor tail protein
MRKNPAGAVDWHQKWEKANKQLIRMWKNIKIQQNPDSSDRDLANIERYRPTGAVGYGIRTDAQIPGVMSYSDIPEELWPFDAPENTAAKQAARRYDDEQAESEVNKAIEDLDNEEAASKERDEEETDGRKRELTVEEQAVLAQRLSHARAVLKKKREEESQLQATLEAVPVTQD